jgi:hypothetical protein
VYFTEGNFESYDAENNLNIRYVTDIDSLMAPRFNPDTRTYFKCSIYSPSNRLYTVNEEVNSTQSDVGTAEQLFNSGMRKSNQRGTSGSNKFSKMRCSGTIIPFPERIMEESVRPSQRIIEEDENDDDTGDVSETIAENMIPTPNTKDLKAIIGSDSGKPHCMSSNPSTSGHTRTNSSKA